MAKTLKRIVHEGNVLSLSGNIIVSLLGLVGFGLLARTFPLTIFGEWVIFITAASFIRMLRSGIMNIALIRYLSGADPEERPGLIGSSVIIASLATLMICGILVGIEYSFSESIHNSGYNLFFKWYPLLALINLPMITSAAIMQADQRFGKEAIIKSFEGVVFFVVIVMNFFFLKLKLDQLVVAFLIVNAMNSVMCIYMRWDGFKYITRANLQTTKKLLNFSKYSSLTLIGTNLLRSADTFIISFSPLGTAAVALYSIPMKLVELQQLPLRSFTATAFPKLSKASIRNNLKELKELFYTYSGAMTYLFLAISLVTFVFADLFVLILGGKQFMGNDPVTGFNAARISRVFTLYGIFLPIDRMTGIGLDSINKPNINFIKVLIMAIANVLGDLIAVFLFKSLTLVAVGSVFFIVIGFWVGYYYLDKELSLNFKHIFTRGIDFYKNLYGNLRKGAFN